MRANATKRPVSTYCCASSNPYKIDHERVMQTIDLLGKHVIPSFA
jgi:hypothetical protein